MQEHPPEPAPENVFEIGLDRARIDSAAHIQYPESNLTDEQSASSDSDSRSPRTSHSVIESIKQKRHKAGAKIRRSLHIGRASDDRGLSTTAIVKDGEHSDSRYAFDPPERDHATFKDFLHNPLDTVKSKVSEQGNQEFAGNLTAKEVPHGDEVEIVRAADAVEAAGTDAQRLLAIQDLAKLLKERQASYARWTFDRHITKVRVLPRDKSELKPRSAFETYDPLEGVVIDWRAYGQHVSRTTFFVTRIGLTDHSCSNYMRRSTEASTLGMARIHRCLRSQPLCRTSSASLLPQRQYKSSS
jgi:hypothetical protein